MEKNRTHWYLTQSTGQLIYNSSWLLFPAIFVLFIYDVVETSLIASHSELYLTAFGYAVPLTTLLSAIAIAIAVRSNAVLVKQPTAFKQHIVTLVIFSVFVSAMLGGVLLIAKSLYLDFLGFESYLSSLNALEQAHISHNVNEYLGFKLTSLIALVIVWQISSVLRVLGFCKLSALYLLTWALTKIAALWFGVQQNSLYLLADIGQVHFFVDWIYALIGLVGMFVSYKLPLLKLDFSGIFKDKRTAIVLILQQLIPAISLTLITAIASRFDSGYVGAFAILFRMETLLLVLPMVFTASIPAVLGINYWAGKMSRCRSLLLTVVSVVVVLQSVISLSLVFFKEPIISLLCADCSQAKIISQYFSYVSWVYFALGCALIYPSCLNAIGRSTQALAFLFYHRLVVVPICTFFGLMFWQTSGFIGAIVIAHLVAFLFIGLSVRRAFGLERQLEQPHTKVAQPLTES